MRHQTLLLLLCLLSSTENAAFNLNLFDDEDNAPHESVAMDDSEKSLFQQAYMNARHLLKKPTDKQYEQEVLPLLWESYNPQILNYKKLTGLINFFIEFYQTSRSLNELAGHSINFCSEDLCSNAPCLLCDYEYDPDSDPDHPKADAHCSKGFCNCMWITPTSIASGFLFMFRTLSSFLWCGPCGVYVSLGLGTCAGAASGACLGCVPTCIKAVRKKLKEKGLKDKVIDLTPVKEQIRLQFANVEQGSCPDQARLKADVQFLQQDQVMNIILNFYKTGEIPNIKSNHHRAEDKPLL